ncbi:MAG: methylmalonyl-CoA epimerase [Thermoplasmata archaeon]|nr:MAG: methylmalonyl-CoA epimerase [Thermoplasmata archaeon]
MARVDHIGIAVRNGEEAVRLYQLLGFRLTGKEYVEDQELWAYFLEGDDGSRIELLEPTGGVIAKFIEKRGEGIHHIAVEVDDVRVLSKKLKEVGFRLIYEEPKKGARSTLVNFIHPKTSYGVLIELIQK